MSVEPEIVFYHAPQSRALIAHWMLEEVGARYRIHLLDLAKKAHKEPAYLAVNPMGKVPAIAHGDVVVTEAAAICAYLADAFPDAGLAPALGERARGAYYRWLFFSPGTLEPAIIDRMLEREGGPSSALGYGDFDTTMRVIADAVARGPFLLGERFTAADVVVGSALRWGMATGTVPPRPEIAAYVGRLNDRPAMKRVEQQNAELMASLGR